MRLWVFPAIATLATAAPLASASESYPAAMSSELALANAPGCELCHDAADASASSADTPFSESLEARGLVGADPASLTVALGRMRDDAVDSDGDGARDLDELSWGGDPNHADLPEGGVKDPITYGCSASSTHEGSPIGLALAALGLVAASRCVTRSRMRRRRAHASRP